MTANQYDTESDIVAKKYYRHLSLVIVLGIFLVCLGLILSLDAVTYGFFPESASVVIIVMMALEILFVKWFLNSRKEYLKTKKKARICS